MAAETGSMQSVETTMAEPWQHRDAAAALQASHLSWLPSSIAMAQRPTSPGIELYKSIGANPVINGIGSVTFLVRSPAAFTEAGEQEAASAG